MFCGNCGAQLSETAQFCGNCGKPVAPSSGVAHVVNEGSAIGGSGLSGASVASKRSYTKIVVGAVIVVAIAVIAFALSGLFSSGYSSSDKLAQKITTAYQDVVDDGFSESSLTAVTNTTLDCMPQEALDAMLAQSGISSRDELLEEFDLSSAASLLSAASLYLSYVDIVFLATPGAALDADEIEAINEQFDELGVDLTVQSAQHLSLTVTITVLEDIGTASAGESDVQTTDESGIILIEIDDAWYLWGDFDDLLPFAF